MSLDFFISISQSTAIASMSTCLFNYKHYDQLLAKQITGSFGYFSMPIAFCEAVFSNCFKSLGVNWYD